MKARPNKQKLIILKKKKKGNNENYKNSQTTNCIIILIIIGDRFYTNKKWKVLNTCHNHADLIN
jgi:hypothetical protein